MELEENQLEVDDAMKPRSAFYQWYKGSLAKFCYVLPLLQTHNQINICFSF